MLSDDAGPITDQLLRDPGCRRPQAGSVLRPVGLPCHTQAPAPVPCYRARCGTVNTAVGRMSNILLVPTDLGPRVLTTLPGTLLPTVLPVYPAVLGTPRPDLGWLTVLVNSALTAARRKTAPVKDLPVICRFNVVYEATLHVGVTVPRRLSAVHEQRRRAEETERLGIHRCNRLKVTPNEQNWSITHFLVRRSDHHVEGQESTLFAVISRCRLPACIPRIES